LEDPASNGPFYVFSRRFREDVATLLKGLIHLSNQDSQLSAGVAQIQTDITAQGAQITTAIADITALLQNSSNPSDPAVTAAISALATLDSTVQAQTAALAASVASVPAPPQPPQTAVKAPDGLQHP
jgi:hypothetical protein